MAARKPRGGYQPAIGACVQNGKSLLEDAELMHGAGRHGTAYAMTILAEEEFSKALLLYLVQDQAVPWSPEVRRAIRDHESKHLLSFLMDHLAKCGEDWLEHPTQQLNSQGCPQIPKQLAAAINLFRHQKIGKWESPGWDVLEPEDYDLQTKRVADGCVDRAKQSAIYVSIGRDGTVLTTPSAVSEVQVEGEIERANRLKELAIDMAHGFVMAFREYDRLREILRAVFQLDVAESGEGSEGTGPVASTSLTDPSIGDRLK